MVENLIIPQFFRIEPITKLCPLISSHFDPHKRSGIEICQGRGQNVHARSGHSVNAVCVSVDMVGITLTKSLFGNSQTPANANLWKETADVPN